MVNTLRRTVRYAMLLMNCYVSFELLLCQCCLLRSQAGCGKVTTVHCVSMQIIASIISLAESKAARTGAPSGEISLPDLLQAYDSVLRQHHIVPEEDSHFYRFLLKLSLEPYTNWWAQLQVRLRSLSSCKCGMTPCEFPAALRTPVHAHEEHYEST
jgi:hypothetical protein